MIGIGIDIGGTFVKLFVLNEKGDILHNHKIETHYAKGAAGFIDELAGFINRFKTEYAGQTLAVAVGAPGDVDNKNGVLRYNLVMYPPGPLPNNSMKKPAFCRA